MSGSGEKMRKADLMHKFEKFECEINLAYLVPNEDSIITLADDRSLRIYIKRDNGGYWPAVYQHLPSPGVCLQYSISDSTIYIGCDNGTIMQYTLRDDFNAVVHVRDYLAHVARITGLEYSQKYDWVLSCGRDRVFAIYSTKTAQCISGFQLQAPCNCLKFDDEAKYVFVGDNDGRISVLDTRKCTEYSSGDHMSKSSQSASPELVKNLNGHSDQPIKSLEWDRKNKKLISCAEDNLVIVWDFGGNKGEALELLGHYKTVTKVISLEASSSRTISSSPSNTNNSMILSSSLDGCVVFWIMSIDRKQTPSWSSSNNCEICNTPFFWNWKKMWEDKKLGGRQHHCRKCGKAVCDKCSSNFSRYPPMGFEIPVRMCGDCRSSVKESDLVPLINVFDTKHPIVTMHFDFDRKQLLTVGKDKLIKLWDVKALLA